MLALPRPRLARGVPVRGAARGTSDPGRSWLWLWPREEAGSAASRREQVTDQRGGTWALRTARLRAVVASRENKRCGAVVSCRVAGSPWRGAAQTCQRTLKRPGRDLGASPAVPRLRLSPAGGGRFRRGLLLPRRAAPPRPAPPRHAAAQPARPAAHPPRIPLGSPAP